MWYQTRHETGISRGNETGNDMSNLSRRGFTFGLLAGTPLLAACGNGVGSPGAARIDARVASTKSHMFANYPGTQDLAAKSTGILVMPVITEGGFFVGGGYGQGALQIDGVTVDYYSATKGSFGLQIGAQQFAHVLFFMTEEALERFRRSSGWAAGADLEYVFNDRGDNLRAETTTSTAPVVAVIFGQAGLLAGASLEGMKYTRIIP
jgi:lipid-binding SYLF domain-containing protein